MKEIGKRWAVLNAAQKVVYEKKARLDKDRYEDEMAQIQRLPPSAVVATTQRRQRGSRRAKKDPNKPRRALTPYILFVKEKRPTITKSTLAESKSFGDIMRMLGDMWKNMPGEEKQKYYDLSEEDKNRQTNACE